MRKKRISVSIPYIIFSVSFFFFKHQHYVDKAKKIKKRHLFPLFIYYYYLFHPFFFFFPSDKLLLYYTSWLLLEGKTDFFTLTYLSRPRTSLFYFFPPLLLMLNYRYVVYDTIHLYFTYKLEQLTPPFFLKIKKKKIYIHDINDNLSHSTTRLLDPS